jgi:thymidylate synthase ThyX
MNLREVACLILTEFKKEIPELFDDILEFET